MDRNVSEILKLHEYVGEIINKPISIFDFVELAHGVKLLNLPASRLDIGKLTFEFNEEASNHSISSFLCKN
jgi:glyceraldehyde 3-phosphate dehydrogenase